MAVTPGDLGRARAQQLEERNKTVAERNAELSAQLTDILGEQSADLAQETEALEKAHAILHDALEDYHG